jgi:ssDNA-binding replication factor A large subunit
MNNNEKCHILVAITIYMEYRSSGPVRSCESVQSERDQRRVGPELFSNKLVDGRVKVIVFFVPQLYYRCFRRIRTKEYYRREIKYKLELFGKFTAEIRKIRSGVNVKKCKQDFGSEENMMSRTTRVAAVVRVNFPLVKKN